MDIRRDVKQIRFSLGGSLTPVVKTLIWINVLVFFFLTIAKGRQLSELFQGPMDTQGLLIHLLGLVPRSVTHDWALWQPFTYMFIHQEIWHLILNMLGLWWFGADVESYMGGTKFLRYYLLTGVGGALAAIALSWESITVTIGASGAVFGLLVAYGFLFPNRTLYLYFLIPVKAIYFVAIFTLITLYALMSDNQGGVSHIAHLGGMVFGVGWFGVARYRMGFADFLRGVRKKRMRRKLRLIRKNQPDDQDPYNTYSNKTLH